MDDLMSSHKDSTVNDKFLKFLNHKYGTHAEMKATCGDTHDYLGMTLIFQDGELIMDMVDYVKNMLEEFPIKFKDNETAVNPAAADMFESEDGNYLETKERELFHRTTVKALFLCKRARPDVQPIVLVLCTREKKPTGKDFIKFV